MQLARDLLLTGSDFHTPFHYGDSQASADLAQLDEGSRRRLEAWGAVQQLQADIDLAFGVASNRTAAWTRRLEESEEGSVVRIHAAPSCRCCFASHPILRLLFPSGMRVFSWRLHLS